jgi:hypothetical protein
METLSEASLVPKKYLLVTEEVMYYKLSMRHKETGEITVNTLTIPRGIYKYCFGGCTESGYDSFIQTATVGTKFTEIAVNDRTYVLEILIGSSEESLPWTIEDSPVIYERVRRIPAVFFFAGSTEKTRICNCKLRIE